jgi:cell division protein FtsB
MAVRGDIRRRVRQVLGPVLGAAIVGYFGYHAVQGERGLIAWWQVTQQIKHAKATLERTGAEREALDRRVSLLRPEHLDPDLLDERARVMLNLAAPDEVVILTPDDDLTPDNEGARAAPGAGPGMEGAGEAP